MSDLETCPYCGGCGEHDASGWPCTVCDGRGGVVPDITTPSARITSDKDRENPVEGAHPYGDGLIGRITALEARLATAAEIIAQIEPDFRHPPSQDSIERRIERAREWLADYTKGME